MQLDQEWNMSEMVEDYIHKQHPKTVGKTEFWKQIKRTVNGKEVSASDIKQIVRAISDGLQLNENDYVLDLGCGNAALASYFLPKIAAYHGVDFSSYLLSIATEYFHLPQKTSFQELDLNYQIDEIRNLDQVNKVLIYGTISYLSKKNVVRLVKKLSRLDNIQRIFIGNIPIKNLAGEFFAKRGVHNFNVNDKKSDIGIWWNMDELKKIFVDNNFECEIKKMPSDFYAAEYRFDLMGWR